MHKTNWNPDKRELRNFALTLLFSFPLIGVILSWKSGEEAFQSLTALYVCTAIAVSVALITFLCPPAGRQLYRAWMGLGYVMGKVVSPIVISLLYLIVVTPIGIMLRLTGHDSLQLKKPSGNSYWQKINHKTQVRSYERQF